MTTTAEPTPESAVEPRTLEGGASFTQLAQRADAARDRVAHAEPAARALLEEALDAVTEFNRAGLVTLVHSLRSDPRGTELLYAAVDAPEVMALLVAHGIVRADRAVDVLRALEQLRPYLVSSGTDAEVVQVDGDVAYVRFAGGGCNRPSDELRESVRATLLARVPGLRAVEEIAAEPLGAFVPLTSLRVGPP